MPAHLHRTHRRGTCTLQARSRHPSKCRLRLHRKALELDNQNMPAHLHRTHRRGTCTLQARSRHPSKCRLRLHRKALELDNQNMPAHLHRTHRRGTHTVQARSRHPSKCRSRQDHQALELEHTGWVSALCQLDHDTLASAGADATRKVWSLKPKHACTALHFASYRTRFR